jgi:multicomponent Na+:H+ antiporter subunit E
MKKLSFFSIAVSFISLMIFWVIMSGFFDAVHLSFGVFSVASVLYVNHKLKKLSLFRGRH